MNVDEQLRYVTDLSKFVEEKLPILEKLSDAWELSHRKDFETGLNILSAFQFARDFVDKALRYGDYAARVYRIRTYIEKIKLEIAKGLSLKGSDGHTYALVSPSIPARRRGRPTAAEQEARKQGITIKGPKDAEMEKQVVIARLMGVDVKVSQDAPREKNNAELAEERAKKQAEYDKQNPKIPLEGIEPAAQPQAPYSMAMSDVYADRISSERLHLTDLAWLCSNETKERIEQVRSQRAVFSAAAERAKLLGEQGADAKVIEPYARQAEEARNAFESTYAAVDEELAIQFKRLSIDLPYIEKFKARFQNVNMEKVLYICRPYYEKVKGEQPEIDLRIKTLIEQDSPEYAAKMKADQEKKEEVTAILRYIRRKDKPNVKQRIQTLEERYKRLVELVGEEDAKINRPIIDAAIEDYEKNIKPQEEAKKAEKKKK